MWAKWSSFSLSAWWGEGTAIARPGTRAPVGVIKMAHSASHNIHPPPSNLQRRLPSCRHHRSALLLVTCSVPGAPELPLLRFPTPPLLPFSSREPTRKEDILPASFGRELSALCMSWLLRSGIDSLAVRSPWGFSTGRPGLRITDQTLWTPAM